MSAFLELKNISKRFGSNSIIEDLNLQVSKGEFLVLVGPSGCGKSTVLRLIAGLEDPSAGEVWIDGKNRNGTEPKSRHIAMVFQHYALYPHMNVYENMAFGLRVGKRLEEKEIQVRVNEAAEMLQLEGLLDRKPKQLSGGQRQRVALGRALVRKPRVFLFDEPLSNLDAHLRNQMRIEIRKLQKRLGITSIYVTHDQIEATTMGDRIAILQKGKLQQIGSPQEVYQKPQNKFVAQFIGSPEMNFFRVSVGSKGDFRLGGKQMSMPQLSPGDYFLGLRPEQLKPGAQANVLSAKVEFTEYLGAHVLVHSRLEGSNEILFTLQENSNLPMLGETLQVSCSNEDMHFFHAESGKRVL